MSKKSTRKTRIGTTLIVRNIDGRHIICASDTMTSICEEDAKKKKFYRIERLDYNKLVGPKPYGGGDAGQPMISVYLLMAGGGMQTKALNPFYNRIRGTKWGKVDQKVGKSAEMKLNGALRAEILKLKTDVRLFTIYCDEDADRVRAYRIEGHNESDEEEVPIGKYLVIGGPRGKIDRGHLYHEHRLAVENLLSDHTPWNTVTMLPLWADALGKVMKFSSEHHYTTGGFCRVHLFASNSVHTTARDTKLGESVLKKKAKFFRNPAVARAMLEAVPARSPAEKGITPGT